MAMTVRATSWCIYDANGGGNISFGKGSQEVCLDIFRRSKRQAYATRAVTLAGHQRVVASARMTVEYQDQDDYIGKAAGFARPLCKAVRLCPASLMWRSSPDSMNLDLTTRLLWKSLRVWFFLAHMYPFVQESPTPGSLGGTPDDPEDVDYVQPSPKNLTSKKRMSLGQASRRRGSTQTHTSPQPVAASLGPPARG